MPLPAHKRPAVTWRLTADALFVAGNARVAAFCRLNGLPAPTMTAVPREHWFVRACGFYRPDTEREAKYRLPGHGPGTNVCLPLCKRPCGEATSRMWDWPGSVIDRTPLGVLAHELGHHCDWLAGERKGRYYSEVCELVRAEAGGEPGLTGYAAAGPHEWFAEGFRLFVTNPPLLRLVRPRTYAALAARWTPLPEDDWRAGLRDAPGRVLASLANRMR